MSSNFSFLEKTGSFPLFVSTNLKMLAPLNRMLRDMLATLTLEPQDNLFGSFSLLVEDRFCLTAITRLLAIITALPLCSQAILSLLILGNLVQGVLFALLGFAVGLFCLRNVNLEDKKI